MSVKSINFEVIKKETIANILADPTVNKENLLEIFLQHGSEVERSADLLGKLLQVLEKSSGELSPSICQRITSAFQRTIQYEDNQWQYTAHVSEYLSKVSLMVKTEKFLQEVRGLLLSTRDSIGKEENTPLHYASANSPENVQIIEFLLKQGWNPNQANKLGVTPLMAACQHGNCKVAQFLLDNGAQPTLTDKEGNTALHFAKSVKVADLLLQRGADIDQKNAKEETPFLAAYRRKNPEVSHFLLLEKGADFNVTNKDGETALILASEAGDLEVVQFLIDKDPKTINQQGEFNYTPLIAACENNHSEVVKLLLKKGAKFDLKDNDGCTALYYAVKAHSEEVVKILLENGADINQKVLGDTCTVLTVAVWMEKHPQLVRLLLEKGASPHVVDEEGDGLLHLVHRLSGNQAITEITAFLLAYGADINAKGEQDRTPLMRACWSNHSECVQLLLEKGANLTLTDRGGKTALHYAASNGGAAVVLELLRKGANVNQQNAQGITPLMLACRRNQLEIVRLLLGKGANPTLTDGNKKTALDYTNTNGTNPTIVGLLLSQGMNTHQQNSSDERPLL